MMMPRNATCIEATALGTGRLGGSPHFGTEGRKPGDSLSLSDEYGKIPPMSYVRSTAVGTLRKRPSVAGVQAGSGSGRAATAGRRSAAVPKFVLVKRSSIP
jgi:hypothetical protein